MFPRSLPSLPPHITNKSDNSGDDFVNEGLHSEFFVQQDSDIKQHDSLPARPLPKRKIQQNKNKASQHEVKKRKQSMEYSDPAVSFISESSKHDLQQHHTNTPESRSKELSGANQRLDASKNSNLTILNRLKNKRLALAVKNQRHKDEDKIETNFTTAPYEETLLVLNPSLLKGNAVSQPTGKIFVEEERGFREVDGIFLSKNCDQSLNVEAALPTTGVELAVNLAVRTQKFFHTFSTWCHGLLAGMALWQCIAIYQLGTPHFETFDFISHYSVLSQPVQTLFYFFLVICTVSAFDRYDIGNPQWSNCKCILSCRTGVVVILIYPASLLLSLSIANIDDKLSLYGYNASLWLENDVEVVIHDLNYWKTLNLGRCIGAVLGWIIIVLQPNINSFLHRLERVEHLSTKNTTDVVTSE